VLQIVCHVLRMLCCAEPAEAQLLTDCGNAGVLGAQAAQGGLDRRGIHQGR
jgi:hypothetical protein